MNTITLTEPIMVDDIPVSELSMREPTVGDLLAIERVEGEARKELALIANLTSMPRETIEKLRIKDYVKIQKVLKDFLLPLEQSAQGLRT